MRELKVYLIEILVCGMLFAGCGTVDKPQSDEGKAAAAEQDAQKQLDRERENQPFNAYMKKYQNRVFGAAEWKAEDGKYQYPLTETDDEWKGIESSEEKYAACQIPEEILYKLDTRALLELVLDCPKLDDVMTYCDSFYDALIQFSKDFNGMYELVNRSDFYKTVMVYYDELVIPSKNKSQLKSVLPDKPESEDYDEVVKDRKLMEKVYDDVKLQHTIEFCITVLSGMTENVGEDMLKQSGDILSEKFTEIEASEYGEGIYPRERWAEEEWIDKNMIEYIGDTGKTEDK